ncbi:MAG: ACP S-malonyltransferase [Gemmatimonadales bacterium]|nr:ACP S-malonyltransferase [Gemmatimonadales bacterium]MYG48735.1 ACP S-malonyltransferase [Gemmatimonadales bacterium]MYK00758.1 ACP S-malonyltransferase [Candidatus Palauibacter ramosifaciens]
MSGVALLFPGQGSQYVGMGRDLADDDASVRELYERADDTLGMPLSRICWEGPEEELRATENAQPAIMLHSFAIWQLIAARAGKAGIGAGHSLGELSAYLVSDAFGFDDGLRIVRERGRLMGASGADRPGTMAAILGLDAAAIARACERAGADGGIAVPANLNAPGQVVISGDVEAVTAAGRLAAEAGARRVLPLNVSGAFHSPLMAMAAEGLAAALEDSNWRDPSFPIVSNATATPVTDSAEARRTLLLQLTSPVRWMEGIDRIRETGTARWLEVGPGNVLSGLARRIDRSLRVTAVGDSPSVNAYLGSAD